MKSFSIILLLIICNSYHISAQHNISIQGGVSISNLQKYGSKTALQGAGVYSDLFSTTPYVAPYLGVEYEFHFKPYVFSTGISFLTIGASDFFYKGYNTAEMYITVPILVGRRWLLPKNFAITARLGFDLGWKVLNFGDVATAGNMNRANGNIGAAGVLQGTWKKFSLGARIHVGLTNYFSWDVNNNKEQIHFRHSAVSVYLGYKIWDSSVVKAKKSKRLGN